MNSDAVAERACTVLSEVFQLDAAPLRGLLVGCYLHDWSADPSTSGAYSYIAKGGIEAPKKFAEALAGTIYFAGEHTTTDGHWGTVHAALSSGLRVAAQIMVACEDPATSLHHTTVNRTSQRATE